MLLWILVFTFLGSFLSLIGGVLILWKERQVLKYSLSFIAFAAGALITTAFVDLLPEALEEGSALPRDILFFTLIGFCTFFIMERFLLWSHHHHDEPEEHVHPTVLLITFGDAVHNFIDGVAIAAAFLAGFPIGVVTALAVGLHEIPQEMGDFAALLHLGLNKKKVLIFNILSAVTALVGAILAYLILPSVETILPYVLALTAGGFIYIAASDLLPELHRGYEKEKAFIQTFAFFLGIAIVWAAVLILGV